MRIRASQVVEAQVTVHYATARGSARMSRVRRGLGRTLPMTSVTRISAATTAECRPNVEGARDDRYPRSTRVHMASDLARLRAPPRQCRSQPSRTRRRTLHRRKPRKRHPPVAYIVEDVRDRADIRRLDPVVELRRLTEPLPVAMARDPRGHTLRGTDRLSPFRVPERATPLAPRPCHHHRRRGTEGEAAQHEQTPALAPGMAAMPLAVTNTTPRPRSTPPQSWGADRVLCGSAAPQHPTAHRSCPPRYARRVGHRIRATPVPRRGRSTPKTWSSPLR
jgi:hypothetical protein